MAIVPFPAANPDALANPPILGNCQGLEPSGLVLINNKLYMASNNGIVARFEQNAWHSDYTATNDTFSSTDEINNHNPTEPDLEAVTVVNGQLMFGIEGDSSHRPQIGRYDTASKKFTSSWLLTPPAALNQGGMEAMTFVPKNYCPTFNNGTPYYGGYFFTAFQSLTGKIYVYDLPQNSQMRGSGGSSICTYDIDISMQTSDMCFANGVLYVLFDGGGADDLLAVYTLHTKQKILSLQSQYSLPTIGNSTKDYEGITLDGQTIYLARDSNTSSANAVYKYPNTIIYPQRVLPPFD